MPKKGPDIGKINLIRRVLRKSPQGLWVREIARKTGLDKSTISIYLAKHMQDELEEVYAIKGGLIKIVKLKKS